MQRFRASRLLEKYMDLPISKKLLLGYIVIILIPTLLLSGAIYQLNYQSLVQQARANENYVFTVTQHSFQTQINQVDSLLAILSSNTVVRQYLSGFYSTISEAIYVQLATLQPLCQYMANAFPNALEMKLYSFHQPGVFPFNFVDNAGALELSASTEYQIRNRLDSIWQVDTLPDGELSVICYRTVYNQDYSIPLGFIRVQMDPAALLNCFTSLPAISLWSPDGELLTRYSGQSAVERAQQLSAPESGDGQVLEPLGLTIRYEFSEEKSLQSQNILLLLSLLGLCVLLMGLFFALVRLATSHLIQLRDHIARTNPSELEKLNIRVYQDEAGQLVTAFNQMVERTNNLIHDVYLSRMKQMDAEHYALQAQIEPHFLFNILENIRMEALTGNGASAANMIQRLGEYMHYNFQRGNSQVPLLEELTHARNYLSIHKIRQSNLNFSIACHTEIDRFRCPCFTLQPLLENALEHGGKGRSSLELQIDVLDGADFGRPGDAAVQIHDNGCGLNPEREAELQKMLQNTDGDQDHSDHVGLYNVSRRLEILWGPEYRLRIRGSMGEGTTVTLFLKETPGEETETHEDSDR